MAKDEDTEVETVEAGEAPFVDLNHASVKKKIPPAKKPGRITFNAIIGWSNALNEGRMQLREILDLEAMLSKGPTAEQLTESEEGGEGGDGEISEKTAGPSIKEEEEVADEPEVKSEDEEEDMVERRTQPQVED